MSLGEPLKTYNLSPKFDIYKNFGATAVIKEYESGKVLNSFNSPVLFVDNNGNFKRFIEDEAVLTNKIIEQCKEFMLQYSDYYNILEGATTKEKIMHLDMYSEDTPEEEEVMTKEKLLVHTFDLDDFKTCDAFSYDGKYSYQLKLIDIENNENQLIFKGNLLQADNLNTLLKVDENDPISVQLASKFSRSVLYCNFDVSIIVNKTLYIEQLLENLKIEEDGYWIDFEQMDFDNIVINQHTGEGYYNIDTVDVDAETYIKDKIKGLNFTEKDIAKTIDTFNVFYNTNKELIDNYRTYDWYNLLKTCCCGSEELIIPSEKLATELYNIKITLQ